MARGFNYAPGASAEVQEAMEPGLDKARVVALGASRNNLVRATIASRQDCPLGLMVTLAHDFSAEVRCCVARNPLAPRTVMAYLSADRSVDVVKALVENPSLTARARSRSSRSTRRGTCARPRPRDSTALTRPAARAATEDVHTPELAEHVVPIQQRMTADGADRVPLRARQRRRHRDRRAHCPERAPAAARPRVPDAASEPGANARRVASADSADLLAPLDRQRPGPNTHGSRTRI